MAMPKKPSTGRSGKSERHQPTAESKGPGTILNAKAIENLFEYAPIGVALTDTIDHGFIQINTELCEMLGYSREELMDLTILDVTHADDVARELKLLNEVIKKKLARTLYEKRLVTKSKKVLWSRVTLCPITDSPNRPPMALSLIQNIQELKDLEVRLDDLRKEIEILNEANKNQLKTLQEKLETKNAEKKSFSEDLKTIKMRFEAIAHAVPDIIFFKNKDLAYTYANTAMSQTFGIPISEIIGRTSNDLFPIESANEIREVDMKVLSGQIAQYESAHWINGKKIYFDEYKAPLKNAEGQIVGIFGLIRNLSDSGRTREFLEDRAMDYPSAAMREAMEKAAFAAETDSIVLLQGESGSGKDFVARWIHDHSKRSSGPFLGINCAALPHELAESELFGHEQGAFTGAKGRKRGLLELAEGGTLLLNEIGELSLALQSKLLTFLDTRSFMRVGGEKSIKVNARIIAASHRNLKEEVEKGRFERALFYRLNVLSINIPPLRERADDIPALVYEMMSRIAREIELKELPEIKPETLAELTQHDWPGNVRELRNVIERGLLISRGPIFRLPGPLTEDSDSWSQKISFPVNNDLNHLIRDIRISVCNEALRRSAGNRSKAAAMLGVSRDAFYRYLKSKNNASAFRTDIDE